MLAVAIILALFLATALYNLLQKTEYWKGPREEYDF